MGPTTLTTDPLDRMVLTAMTHQHEHRDAPESPFLIERLLREVRRQNQGTGFASEEDFRVALQSLLDEGLEDRRLTTLQNDPVELAQELAYQAYESETGDEALAHCQEALRLDPGCVDALTITALMTSEDAGALIDALEHAADCAEQTLGQDYFEQSDGSFWSLVAARPYLRTLKQLAEVLWSVGRRFDAVDTYELLLDLDPEDHAGHATLLLSCYLSMGEVQRSWDLLEELDDDESALYRWAWVLIDLMSTNTEAARESLDRAIEANPHVISYLLGLEEAEPELAPYVKAGSEAEARVCAQILADAWDRNPDALMWLERTLADLGLIEAPDDDLGPDYDDDLDYIDSLDDRPETKH